MILVINHNQTAYIQKYKLFYHAEEAIEWANELGFSKHSFIKISPEDLKPGVLHFVDAAESCNIEMIKIVPEVNIDFSSSYDRIGWGGC